MEYMKAWTHARAGRPSEILTLTERPLPKITSATQVLVRVSHCALNPAGSIVMQLLPFIFRTSPATPEMDFAGTIIDMGSDVPGHRQMSPGTKVFGSIPVGQHARSTSGALAEFVVVDHTSVVKKPDAVAEKEVAGLGIAGATALQLVKAASLEKGNSVLINGASGGIGHLVMQMCRNVVGPSARFVVVCSSENSEWVKRYGTAHQIEDKTNPKADSDLNFQLIEYDRAPLIPFLIKSFRHSKFDAVIDAVGIQDIFDNSPEFLKEGKPYVTVGPKAHTYTYTCMLGTLVTMAKNALWPQRLGGTARPYAQVAAASSLESLETLAKMVEEGILRVHVGKLVRFGEVQTLYADMAAGHAKGKTVVEIRG